MPELPEVEVVTLGLAPHLLERTIASIVWRGRPLRLAVPEKEFVSTVIGQEVVAVGRRAKYIVIGLANGAKLIIHLGMTGRLGIFAAAEPLKIHDHLVITLENGLEVRFNDTRRFGSVQVLGETAAARFFGRLGPEPFSKKYCASYLSQKAQGKKQPVKNFLMDGQIVVGIGNIYASEILFAAKILPETPAGALHENDWRRIVTKTRKVLRAAIDAGGTTIADFVNLSGTKGYFQLRLQVYGRQHEPCPICASKIIKTVMAGRATYFCPVCQK